MKLLKIKPCDNTFFREGDRFESKISNIIKTKNIAYPSTFFGAIFSAILALNPDFRNQFLKKEKNKDHLEILKIKQIYLFNEEQDLIYIPAPKDLFVSKQAQNVYYGKFVKAKEKCISIPYNYYLEEPDIDEIERADDYYVNIDDLYEKYYYKDLTRSDLKHKNEIFSKNLKTGIGLDKSTGTVKESYLYTIEQTEFKNSSYDDWCYVVEYDINYEFLEQNYTKAVVDDLEKGYLKLGGESKVCKFGVIENKKIEEFRLHLKEKYLIPGEKLKVILTSESYFKDKLKDDINEQNYVKLQALVNDKPIFIGGFDIVENKPKVMYKGYTPGTVLLLENISKDKVDIQAYLKEKIEMNVNNGFNQYIYIKEGGNE